MKQEILQKAKNLENSIWYCKQDLESIKIVIEDFDNFGSCLQFKRNKDGLTKSFGSKKFDFKKELLLILNSMSAEISEELKRLNKELENL
jgi:hypothetical protein